MASTSVAVQRAAAGQRYGPTDWWGGWRTCILACSGFTVLFVALGLYMHAFAWYAGIDASSPEFALYWRSLLILELVGVGAGTIGWWAWLVRSGRTLAQAITREEEVRRIVVFWGLIGATSVVLYFMASFFPNSDGAWHQTAVRDTAFTPPQTSPSSCSRVTGTSGRIGRTASGGRSSRRSRSSSFLPRCSTSSGWRGASRRVRPTPPCACSCARGSVACSSGRGS